MIYLIAAIVLLGVLITIHEFGHFIVARMCNIHVIRFSIGMGPVIYKKSDSKCTEYALSALPLGGYVAMLTSRGMEEDQSLKDSLTDEQQGMVFEAQPKLKRAAVMLAGPMANFILAIFILAVIYANSIQRTFITEITAINDPVITQESVLQKGDVIAAINGKSISNLQDLRLELLSHSGSDDQIVLQIERGPNNSFAYNLNLNNFLASTEAQESPEDYLGFDLELKIAPYIGGFSETSMAPSAGLKVNDKIIGINSQSIRTYDDIAEVMQSFSNSEVAIEVLRDGESLTFMVPLLTQNIDGQAVNIIGITAGTQKSITESLLSGIYDTYTMSAKTLLFVGKMISGSMGAQNLSGPIGIVKMAGDTAKVGILPFLYLMALLSISLGVLNLLPIPVLDGGQLTLLAVEAIKGSPLSERLENYFYTGGWIAVVALMIFAVFNDILRFI